MTELTRDQIDPLVHPLIEAAGGTVLTVAIDANSIGLVIAAPEISREAGSKLEHDLRTALAPLAGTRDIHVVFSQPRRAPDPRAVGGKAPPRPEPIKGVKHIVAVASGKGGVGKSTTSLNLAVALQTLGLTVGLLDVDIFGPSLPTLIGSNARPEAKDKVLQPIEAFGLQTMSIGFLLEADQPVVWRGPRVMGATQQMLKDVAWDDLDVLVVDMPPGTGDVQLTMVQQAPLSGAVIVSTPQDLALIDARKGIAMFEKVGVPILGLLENMSHFICPKCGETTDIYGEGGARKAAEDGNIPFLGALPLSLELRISADAGKPFVLDHPESPITEAYLSAAKAVAQRLALL